MHIAWLRKAANVTFDATRTANIPALDNAAAYAQFINGERDLPRRAHAVVAAAAGGAQPAAVVPPAQLTAGDRVELMWGDTYFAGTFTSSRSDHEHGRRLHRIMYDAVQVWRAQAHWHDLSVETWRRI